MKPQTFARVLAAFGVVMASHAHQAAATPLRLEFDYAPLTFTDLATGGVTSLTGPGAVLYSGHIDFDLDVTTPERYQNVIDGQAFASARVSTASGCSVVYGGLCTEAATGTPFVLDYAVDVYGGRTLMPAVAGAGLPTVGRTETRINSMQPGQSSWLFDISEQQQSPAPLNIFENGRYQELVHGVHMDVKGNGASPLFSSLNAVADLALVPRFPPATGTTSGALITLTSQHSSVVLGGVGESNTVTFEPGSYAVQGRLVFARVVASPVPEPDGRVLMLCGLLVVGVGVAHWRRVRGVC